MRNWQQTALQEVNNMNVRRATEKDIPAILELLVQVDMVHHNGRPDLFKAGGIKYTDEELLAIFEDPERPVFVEEEAGRVLGYAFCMLEETAETTSLRPVRTLYLDDLCVDEDVRGRHVGTRLYNHVLGYAREQGYYNVTLNVWACNESARRFYEHLGLVPQKYGMEAIL
jgi:ribosomal protein S18 acetylase RimI-like enzyme